jgi:hypothetical protein
MTGKSIRQFLRDLLGSRLAEVMQTEILRLQMENQQLRQDKDQTIAELRSEKAQLAATVSLYQMNINARVGIDPTRKRAEKPSFASFTSPKVKTAWQAEQEEHDARIAKELMEEAAEAAAATAAKV